MASVELKTIKDSQNPEWMRCDVGKVFDMDELQKLSETVVGHKEVSFALEQPLPLTFDFPDFGASRLQPTALEHICQGLSQHLEKAVVTVSDVPAYLILERQRIVWGRVIRAVQQQIYLAENFKRIFTNRNKEEAEAREGEKDEDKATLSPSSEKIAGNEILVEMGIKTGLGVVFTLLKQAWAQLAWQRQVEEQLQAAGKTLSLPSFSSPQISLPNEVLRSVLDVLKGIAPLSLANDKMLSKMSIECLKQSAEFLDWIVGPEAWVDEEGKRLALEITLNLALQRGSLISLLEWAEKALACLSRYKGFPEGTSIPSLSVEFCQQLLEEVYERTVSERGRCPPYPLWDLTVAGVAEKV